MSRKSAGRVQQHAFAQAACTEAVIIERRSDFEPRARQEGDPRGGELKAKIAEKLVPIPLKHTDVKAQVSIYIASVTVKQQ